MPTPNLSVVSDTSEDPFGHLNLHIDDPAESPPTRVRTRASLAAGLIKFNFLVDSNSVKKLKINFNTVVYLYFYGAFLINTLSLMIHWETYVSLIILMRADYRGGTTKAIFV